MCDGKGCPYDNIDDCPRVQDPTRIIKKGMLEVAGRIADSERISSDPQGRGSSAGMKFVHFGCPRVTGRR